MAPDKASLQDKLDADIEFVISMFRELGQGKIAASVADPTDFEEGEPIPFNVSSSELTEALARHFHLDDLDGQPVDGQVVGSLKTDPTILLVSNGLPDEFYLE